MVIKTKYEGTINWHEGNPDKKGRYLVTLGSGWVDVVTFYKENGKNVFETSSDSEDGGRITFDNVKAWAYLPEPYCNNN